MMPQPDSAAAPDPLRRDVPLERAIGLRVVGVPVRVESNSAEVIAVAREAFGPADEPQAGETPLVFRVLVEPGGRSAAGHARLEWRMVAPDLLLVRADGVAASIDMAAGRAAASIEERIVRDREHFRYSLLSGTVFSLIGHRDRHPVHAAAIRSGDAAVLLQGPSGVGKSTLAYVAVRDGLTVLAEDAVYVQRRPELRVWGIPGRVHLLDDARHRWTELREHGRVRPSSGGGTKLAVSIAASGEGPHFARRVRVCLLDRRGGPVTHRVASPAEIRDALLSAPEAQADMLPDARPAVVEALAAAGGWRMSLSSDPHEALPHLRAMLAEVSG